MEDKEVVIRPDTGELEPGERRVEVEVKGRRITVIERDATEDD